MTKLGYHVSHEQFSPRDLLRYVVKAEEAGFRFALSSDHFYSWGANQGQSGFAWSWLGAALARTKSMRFGIVNCPCYRYHPAIIAQAVATLQQMFPERFWIAIGSGQALNEAVVGGKWPAKIERNKRLEAAAEIMRALWKGEKISRDGLIKVDEARLETLPEKMEPLIAAAITPQTARWVAGWADGLITISQPMDKLQELVNAWKSGGGEKKTMKIKVQISYDKTRKEALEGAHHQWKTNVFGSEMMAQLRTPEQFDQAAKYVRPEEVEEMIHVSDSTSELIDILKKYAELGFEEIIIHNVNTKQDQFIEKFGKNILSEFNRIGGG